jgi:hypothetical protein
MRRVRTNPRAYLMGACLAAVCLVVLALAGRALATPSVRSLKVGSAYRSHGHTIYYGRVPSKCPKGGLLMKTEVIFAEDGETTRPETVDASSTASCPRH